MRPIPTCFAVLLFALILTPVAATAEHKSAPTLGEYDFADDVSVTVLGHTGWPSRVRLASR